MGRYQRGAGRDMDILWHEDASWGATLLPAHQCCHFWWKFMFHSTDRACSHIAFSESPSSSAWVWGSNGPDLACTCRNSAKR
eukprot:6438392-Amphidinium_carterae.2